MSSRKEPRAEPSLSPMALTCSVRAGCMCVQCACGFGSRWMRHKSRVGCMQAAPATPNPPPEARRARAIQFSPASQLPAHPSVGQSWSSPVCVTGPSGVRSLPCLVPATPRFRASASSPKQRPPTWCPPQSLYPPSTFGSPFPHPHSSPPPAPTHHDAAVRGACASAGMSGYGMHITTSGEGKVSRWREDDACAVRLPGRILALVRCCSAPAIPNHQ